MLWFLTFKHKLWKTSRSKTYTILVIQKIGVGIEVTLIDNITHAFEDFRTLDIVLKDTLVTKRQKSQPIPLVEPIDTTCE
jgi:hypothetical protein